MTRERVRVTGWLTAIVAALAIFLVPLPPQVVEGVYSRRAFPVWQSWVTSVSNLAPFAILDVLILLVATLTLWRIWRLIGRARASGPVAALWEGVRRLVRAVAVLAVVFVAMWGLNYRRVPLDRTVPPASPSTADLRAALEQAGVIGARLRAGRSDAPSAADELTRSLREPFARALARLGRPALGTPGRPKQSILLEPFFTVAGVDGMVDPFALEAIVGATLLPFERPFVLAHEWAHLAGTADEAEASAIGWLACMYGEPRLAYSGSLYLIVETASALPRTIWFDERQRLDAGILADLEAMSRRQARQQPQIQRAAFQAYDRYLRANRVEDGVASYSRALSLILSPALGDARQGRDLPRDGRP